MSYFEPNPPVVKLSPKSLRGHAKIAKHGNQFLLISKMPNKKLIATKCGKWYTYVEDKDKDFEIVGAC